MNNRATKGQAFFKFLWRLECYQTQGGVSPRLALELKSVALKNGAIRENKTLTNKTVFNWINGSIIPAWARKAGFELALSHGWQPVDGDDVNTVLAMLEREISGISTKEIVEKCQSQYDLRFPTSVLVQVLNERSIK